MNQLEMTNVYKTFSLNKMINKWYYSVGTVIKSNR
jgi:hypothetical protein